MKRWNTYTHKEGGETCHAWARCAKVRQLIASMPAVELTARQAAANEHEEEVKTLLLGLQLHWPLWPMFVFVELTEENY